MTCFEFVNQAGSNIEMFNFELEMKNEKPCDFMARL
jgi:hypothetical protein